jgi:hypothetical protein
LGVPRPQRALDILSHQIGIDGDRRSGAGAGRGDHPDTQIGHVAGCPDASHARAASGID